MFNNNASKTMLQTIPLYIVPNHSINYISYTVSFVCNTQNDVNRLRQLIKHDEAVVEITMLQNKPFYIALLTLNVIQHFDSVEDVENQADYMFMDMPSLFDEHSISAFCAAVYYTDAIGNVEHYENWENNIIGEIK